MIGFPSAGQLSQLAISLSCLLVLVCIGGSISRKFGLLPLIGEILVGILVGPSVFGASMPDVTGWLFPKETALFLGTFVQLGLIFFLFVEGFGFDLDKVRHSFKEAKWIAIGSFAVPIIVCFPVFFFANEHFGNLSGVNAFGFAGFMASAISVTAIPVLLRVMKATGLDHHDAATAVKTAAVICDFLGSLALALLISTIELPGQPAGSHHPWWHSVIGFSAMIAGLFIGGPRLMNFIFGYMYRRGWSSEYKSGTMIALSLIGYVLAEKVFAVHGAFGALFMGAAVGATNIEFLDKHIRHMKEHFVQSVFAVLFFVTIGLRANFVQSFNLVLVIEVFLIASLTKMVGAYLFARIAGHNHRISIGISLLMNARGVMEIVMASIGLQIGLIGSEMFVALVIMALGTSLQATLASRFMKIHDTTNMDEYRNRRRVDVA
jgi:Kef-type K+ transport system membrane component KefB